MPPGLFNRKIINTLEAMYSEEVVAVVDNILNLLYISDKNCTQFSKEEINCMLTFLCITYKKCKYKIEIFIYFNLLLFICLSVFMHAFISVCMCKYIYVILVPRLL